MVFRSPHFVEDRITERGEEYAAESNIPSETEGCFLRVHDIEATLGNGLVRRLRTDCGCVFRRVDT